MAQRQPTFYLTHGGGPCFWMTYPEPVGPHGYDGLKNYLASLLASLPERPQAIVMATAHWEAPSATVSTASAPPMLYDYYGFPPHTYQLQYPAPGSPELGTRVRGLLEQARIPVTVDNQRGFDHGVFVPMLIVDPDSKIPVVMLSIQKDYDPAQHLAMGAALEPLRDEGVLIIGSGSSFHNMRTIRDGADQGSAEFDGWLHDTLTQTDASARNARLLDWTSAPSARAVHPREDHLIPLMVAAGAAGGDPGHHSFRDVIGGKVYSCFEFGLREARAS